MRIQNLPWKTVQGGRRLDVARQCEAALGSHYFGRLGVKGVREGRICQIKIHGQDIFSLMILLLSYILHQMQLEVGFA